MVKLPSSPDVYWRYVGDADDSWVPATLYSAGEFTVVVVKEDSGPMMSVATEEDGEV